MKILLVEDQTMVRTALAGLLRLESEYEVDEAENGLQAKQMLEQQTYDLILTDIEMPEMTGLELLQWVKQAQPQVLTVIITTFNRSGYIQRALANGANAILLKDAPIEELLNSITQVKAGHRVVNNELLLQTIGHQDPLTDKERKALALAADGRSTAQIATSLFVAEGTARNYLSEAISKLHAENRIDAARIAKMNGWL
ncbi:two component transcriptional regulator, LuxR family [Pseudidiomarina planktonica]|uniref:Two component transcriptional regulator, LuxR family n=1 Tax=Pseudidiomarina planktonica TaxID=1323738 RepID=A0A1Y6EUW1_9GAMM|nr:response regulator transcription factor [Pseudidiomarina planktonica]RUO65431.1 DNA-binding response regulator [Pseudidiomarina planktonica]SMQ65031.1 two component transcriptional regulator, LuxR family [Pseudidiomarina planktonica]